MNKVLGSWIHTVHIIHIYQATLLLLLAANEVTDILLLVLLHSLKITLIWLSIESGWLLELRYLDWTFETYIACSYILLFGQSSYCYTVLTDTLPYISPHMWLVIIFVCHWIITWLKPWLTKKEINISRCLMGRNCPGMTKKSSWNCVTPKISGRMIWLHFGILGPFCRGTKGVSKRPDRNKLSEQRTLYSHYQEGQPI